MKQESYFASLFCERPYRKAASDAGSRQSRENKSFFIAYRAVRPRLPQAFACPGPASRAKVGVFSRPHSRLGSFLPILTRIHAPPRGSARRPSTGRGRTPSMRRDGHFLTRRIDYFRAHRLTLANERKSEPPDNEAHPRETPPQGSPKAPFLPLYGTIWGQFSPRKCPWNEKSKGWNRKSMGWIDDSMG